jgi:hypothetical protein
MKALYEEGRSHGSDHDRSKPVRHAHVAQGTHWQESGPLTNARKDMSTGRKHCQFRASIRRSYEHYEHFGILASSRLSRRKRPFIKENEPKI